MSAFGMRQPSKMRLPVLEARMPSLSSFLPREKPGVPASTREAESVRTTSLLTVASLLSLGGGSSRLDEEGGEALVLERLVRRRDHDGRVRVVCVGDPRLRRQPAESFAEILGARAPPPGKGISASVRVSPLCPLTPTRRRPAWRWWRRRRRRSHCLARRAQSSLAREGGVRVCECACVRV